MNSFTFYQDNTQTFLPQSYFGSYFQYPQDNTHSFFDNNFGMFNIPDNQLMTFLEPQDSPKNSPQAKSKQNSSTEAPKNMASSFADLVSQSSAFWTSRMSEHASRTQPADIEGCENIQAKNEDIIKQNKKAAKKDNLISVLEKQIKKLPKKGSEKWQRKHDSRLLSLVKELGQDWTEVAGAFEESFVTPKYVEDRYKVICSKKSGLKSQASVKEEEKTSTRPSSLKEEDNESWTDFLYTAKSDYTKNQFSMAIKEEQQEYGFAKMNSEICQDFIGYEQLQPTREASSQGYENTPERSQDDIIDSYFNTDNFQELETTLLENSHFLEKIDFSEGLEEANQKVTPVKVEEDNMGERFWEMPKEEVIEVLNGRISLIQNLYNQTWIELMKLQREKNLA